MGKLAELHDLSKWGENGTPLWDINVTAEPGQPTANPKIYWKPIDRQFCPFLVQGPVLAIQCDNFNKKPSWRFAGFLNIFLHTALNNEETSPVGNFYNTWVAGKKIYLDNIQLVTLPQYSSEFGIAIDVPYWFNHFTMRCWDYRGLITTEELTEIARVRGTQLTIIERLQQLNYQMNLIDQNTNYL